MCGLLDAEGIRRVRGSFCKRTDDEIRKIQLSVLDFFGRPMHVASSNAPGLRRSVSVDACGANLAVQH